MIAEEYNYSHHPSSSIPTGTTIHQILNCFKAATPFFKIALNQLEIIKPLNENKLTQIFVEQVDIQLRKMLNSIGVKNQYSDIFFDSKGLPDFYFHVLEEGRVSTPIYIVEAKRLPAPSGSLETEYVIGAKSNGGIERYKKGKHGKGHSEAGMLGFIEEKSPQHWIKKINHWISELAKTNSEWKNDEMLGFQDLQTHFIISLSMVHRISSEDLKLNHFWIA